MHGFVRWIEKNLYLKAHYYWSCYYYCYYCFPVIQSLGTWTIVWNWKCSIILCYSSGYISYPSPCKKYFCPLMKYHKPEILQNYSRIFLSQRILKMRRHLELLTDLDLGDQLQVFVVFVLSFVSFTWEFFKCFFFHTIHIRNTLHINKK